MAEFLDSRTLGASASGAFEAPAAQRIGRFELRREIARGGMGIVFEAYDPDLRQRVALKLLHPWSAADDETRFRREAQVIARLRHPNVVRVYALGRDCGRSYLVLDYVDGESLAQRLERVGGTLSGLEAIDVLEPIARAAHYAHCRGVVHRDLKPANVLLPRLGGPQLVDFGLAKDLTASNPLTQHGELLGTPPYMAPEQVVGAPLDSRTDVYGLGATLYRTLTGRHPYDGALLEVLDAVVNAPVPCPSDVVEVDPRLAAISRRCMAKDPAQRYPTAEAVAEALAACRAPALSLRVFGSTFALPAAATFFYGRAPEETPPGTRLLRRRSLLPMAASLVAACAVLPLAGLLLSGDGRRGAVAAKEGASERVARGASPGSSGWRRATSCSPPWPRRRSSRPRASSPRPSPRSSPCARPARGARSRSRPGRPPTRPRRTAARRPPTRPAPWRCPGPRSTPSSSPARGPPSRSRP
ncbi:MAG: serine/threonine-protein kinase [Planctomycetota bacterium]